MAEVVNMPRLSDTMEEGVVAKWLKQKGDKVEEGDILAEIETDKATMEFESFHDGVLLHIGVEEGEGAPVDTLLAIIGEEGEDIEDLIKGAKDNNTSKESEDEKSESKDDKKSKEEDGKVEGESDGEKSDEDAESGDGIPDDVEVVTMPRLSDTMEEGTVATWLKSVGDDVEEGEILAEIETDKATMEFESFYSGKLLYIGIDEGDSAPVDDVLAIIGPEGTDVDKVLASLKSGGKSSSKDSEKKSKEKSSKDDKSEETKSQDSANESSTQDLSGDEDADNTDADGRILASPLAKKIAEDKGIDLRKVSGSGDNGRIVKKDVEDYKPSEKPAKEKTAETKKEQPKKEEAAPQPVAEIYTPAGEESFEDVKNSQMRKTIAKRLLESKNSAPHYYLNI